MRDVRLERDQWVIALAAVEGLRVQLLASVGPMADGGSPRSMAAVRLLGDLGWIERAFREAAKDP